MFILNRFQAQHSHMCSFTKFQQSSQNNGYILVTFLISYKCCWWKHWPVFSQLTELLQYIVATCSKPPCSHIPFHLDVTLPYSTAGSEVPLLLVEVLGEASQLAGLYMLTSISSCCLYGCQARIILRWNSNGELRKWDYFCTCYILATGWQWTIPPSSWLNQSQASVYI